MDVNWNAVAIVAAGAAISASIVLPERARVLALRDLQGSCWRADTQANARQLAISTMQPLFKQIVKADEPRWTDAELDKAIAIELDHFFLVKVDTESLAAVCGALIDLSLTGANGRRVRSSGNVLEFNVHADSPTTSAVTMSSGPALEAAMHNLKPDNLAK